MRDVIHHNSPRRAGKRDTFQPE